MKKHCRLFFHPLSVISKIIIITSVLWTQPVLSEPVRGDTVDSRIHPQFLPLGMGLDGFRLYPKFTYTGMSNDNVFANDAFKRSSFVSEYSPELSIISDWNKHALNFFLTADLGRNNTFSSENYDDWEISTDGKIDIQRYIQLLGGATMARDHIDRTSPSNAGGLIPTVYDQAIIYGRYRQRLGLYLMDIGANIEQRDYRNVPGIQAGSIITIDNDQRDRTISTLTGAANYEYIRDQQAFLRLKLQQRDYKNLQSITNNERSSDSYEASAGFDFDLNGILVGEFSVGYASRNYTTPFPDISTPAYDISINWNITRMTTFRFDADRVIRETFIRSFSGYTSTTTEIGVDHELQRNLQLNASLFYRDDDYAGIGNSTRKDTTYDIVMGSTYTLSRHLNVSIQYHYLERKSVVANAAGRSNDFINNVIFLQLQTQY